MSSLLGFARSNRVPLALALLVVVVVGPVVAPDTAQPASRLSLTAAMVEHRSIDLGRYEQALNVDFAVYKGRLRSDKAPGQPLFAIPAYVVARAVGAESATHLRVDGNLGLWFLTFWSATLPLAALVALIYVECARFARRGVALAVTLLLAFGTMLLPYGANLFAHDLAALLGFGAWMVVNRTPLDGRRATIAGLLVGMAVLVEYETAIIGVALSGYLLVRSRPYLLRYVAGGIPPMLVLAFYQWRAFGAPWRTPAAYYNLRSGYTIPTPYDLWWMFGGGRGLYLGAPLAIVGIGAAAWLAIKGRGAVRDASIVALAIVGAYIVLCAGWSGTPLLVDPGPRYLIPSLPFLAVPLAFVWDRVRVVGVPASVLGLLVAFTATWSSLLSPRDASVLAAYRYFLQHHLFGPTLWSMGLGRAGLLVYVITVAGAVVILAMAYGHRTDVRSPVPEPLR